MGAQGAGASPVCRMARPARPLRPRARPAAACAVAAKRRLLRPPLPLLPLALCGAVAEGIPDFHNVGLGGRCLARHWHEFDDSAAVKDYYATCETYKIKPAADLLNRLQIGSGNFIVEPGSGFGNMEFRALTKLLSFNSSENLFCVESLDLSKCKLGTSSMLLLAEMLRQQRSCIKELDLSYQDVGAEGMAAIAEAVKASARGRFAALKRATGDSADAEAPPPCEGQLRLLRLRGAGIGDEGALALASLIRSLSLKHFVEIDLQNNNMGATVCTELSNLASERGFTLALSGNRVYDEVWNAVTHGLGEVLVIVGNVFLCRRASKKARYTWAPIIMYCIALHALYISSTLFHAFFALGKTTVYIFSILDFSGIFMLIAGSYSPFFCILFNGEAWARMLLSLMWAIAGCGIFLAATYSGPGANTIRLTLFLVMGWAAVVCLPKITAKVGRRGSLLLLAGGVAYTVGVPWWIRDKSMLGFPDHAIWHLWVILGSLSHYFCIFWYVLGTQHDQDMDAGIQLGRGSCADGTALTGHAVGDGVLAALPKSMGLVM